MWLMISVITTLKACLV